MTPFLSRVYDCKHRFIHEHGIEPPQSLLGPREYDEFDEMCRQQTPGLHGNVFTCTGDFCAGMTIIHLATDGMLAGITTT